MNPEFPVVEGRYRFTEDWSLALPDRFNRRIEDGELCIWRPGFTIWLIPWNNDDDETPAERLAWLREDASEDAFDLVEEESNGLLRFSYRLDEDSDDDREAALYGFVIGAGGHVQTAIYFDDGDDLPLALAVWRSIAEG